jgi:hypothetical protein
MPDAPDDHGNPVIVLKPWEYQSGFMVGIGRFVANWGYGDAAHYDRSRMEEDRNAQAAAAICEIAVARHTNKYWHGHVWHPSEHRQYRAIPDVGTNIEVRRVRTKQAVAVRRSDAGREVWAARTVDPEYRKVEIIGFIRADDFIKSLKPGQDWGYAPLETLERPWELQKCQ